MLDTGTTAVLSESGQPNIFLTILILAVLVWEAVWKGFAMWHAARNSQKNWFIALLIFNTLGILSIIYLKFYQKKAKA